MASTTGRIVAVREKPIYDAPFMKQARTRIGTRFDVWLFPEGNNMSHVFYTVNAWIASLCLHAQTARQIVTVETTHDKWGVRIDTVTPVDTAEKASA